MGGGRRGTLCMFWVSAQEDLPRARAALSAAQLGGRVEMAEGRIGRDVTPTMAPAAPVNSNKDCKGIAELVFADGPMD